MILVTQLMIFKSFYKQILVFDRYHCLIDNKVEIMVSLQPMSNIEMFYLHHLQGPTRQLNAFKILCCFKSLESKINSLWWHARKNEMKLERKKKKTFTWISCTRLSKLDDKIFKSKFKEFKDDFMNKGVQDELLRMCISLNF